MGAIKFKKGDFVQVVSKTSKYRGIIGVVERYCSGTYDDILKLKLWDNHYVNFREDSLQHFPTPNKCETCAHLDTPCNEAPCCLSIFQHPPCRVVDMYEPKGE